MLRPEGFDRIDGSVMEYPSFAGTYNQWNARQTTSQQWGSKYLHSQVVQPHRHGESTMVL